MIPGEHRGEVVVGPRGKVFAVDKPRFVSLWSRVGAGEDADDVFSELQRRYAEPGRRYHTAAHIDHCLRQFDLAARHAAHPEPVELALWFHDALYRAGATENEQRSAEWFAGLAGPTMDASVKAKVCDLILATAHRSPPADEDEALIVDVDLSGLGLGWDEFSRDLRAIREESSHLSPAEFFSRHRGFMESLLDREHIYFTDLFRARYEQRARANLQRALQDTMRQPPPVPD